MHYEPLRILLVKEHSALTAEPGHQSSLAKKTNSLQRLGTNSENLNAMGFYTSDAARTGKKL